MARPKKLRKNHYYSTIRLPKKLYNQLLAVQNKGIFKPSMNDLLITLIALGLRNKVITK